MTNYYVLRGARQNFPDWLCTTNQLMFLSPDVTKFTFMVNYTKIRETFLIDKRTCIIISQ